MTYRDYMRENGGNIDWCKPVTLWEGRIAVTLVEGEIDSMQIDGQDVEVTLESVKRAAMMANEYYSQYRGYDDTHMLLECDSVEMECRDCHWFNVCFVMDEEFLDG